MNNPADSAQIGQFDLISTDGSARTGRFHTRSGSFETPAFMPVGTLATVKGMTVDMLKSIGAQIILSNTYHLHLRPGEKIISDLGDIHKFIGWEGPILTDSGGYQVFSLASLRNISEEGVRFKSHLDGAPVFFTPEKVIEIQETLGVDIMMVLDECLPPEAEISEVRSSWDRTYRWAERSLLARKRNDILPFGIVQGGMFDEERARSVEDLKKLPFAGYAIGGLSVGESKEQMRRITSFTTPLLPETKPRYLMGVGTPLDIVESVYCGIDMFDCVIPTRSARFGRIYTFDGHFNIRNAKYRTDSEPLEQSCDCYACINHSRAYISHLIHADEILGSVLATIHNLRFYQRLMSLIRDKIKAGEMEKFLNECRMKWQS